MRMTSENMHSAKFVLVRDLKDSIGNPYSSSIIRNNHW